MRRKEAGKRGSLTPVLSILALVGVDRFTLFERSENSNKYRIYTVQMLNLCLFRVSVLGVNLMRRLSSEVWE